MDFKISKRKMNMSYEIENNTSFYFNGDDGFRFMFDNNSGRTMYFKEVKKMGKKKLIKK